MSIVVKVLFSSFFFLLVGCSNSAHTIEKSIASSMTYDECVNSKFCKVSGILSLESFDDVTMGKLEVDKSRCITVSLPDRVIEELKTTEPVQKTLSGWSFGPTHDGMSVLLEIKGRPVAHGRCGDFYLFVE